MQTSTVSKGVLALLFSFCLHGGIIGILFMFSADSQVEPERVYHVALAEFVQPGIAREAPAPEAPEPVVEATPPSPPPSVPEPEPKDVSTIKPTSSLRARPEPKPYPSVTQHPSQPSGEPSSPPVQVASGPRPRQFGGFFAYDQDHVDQRPSISRRFEPEYPARARRMNVEGMVVVELIVDTGGLPKACAVHSAEPSGYFEEAALNAAQKMRFIPGKISGAPVNTLVQLPFVFRLR
ncbi:MAG: TonB family protein [Deltaproteobacteria bacterium]|jgi:protein TonB|nr:TonB family protein [Deltaproteobacteria bacterium]